MPPPANPAQTVARRSTVPVTVPEPVWSPMVGGVLTLVPALLGLAFGQPWLFPSLGPTAYIQATQPHHPTSRFPNVVLGDLVAAVTGIVLVLLFLADGEPSLFESGELTGRRVVASVVGVAATLFVGVVARPTLHPPAAATTLIVTLGGFPPTWWTLGVITAGVLVTAIVGEGFRRMRLAQPGQK